MHIQVLCLDHQLGNADLWPTTDYSFLQSLSKPENILLHKEVRQFLSFVQNSHGGIFRRVILSGIIESLPKVEQEQVHIKDFRR